MKPTLKFYKETYLTPAGFQTDYIILNSAYRIVKRFSSYQLLLKFLAKNQGVRVNVN